MFKDMFQSSDDSIYQKNNPEIYGKVMLRGLMSAALFRKKY
jgi:hypothetical protein